MAGIQDLTLAKNNRAMLLLALIAGLVAAAAMFVVLNSSSSNDNSGTSAGNAPVVVAAQDISAGTEITAAMLKAEKIQDSLVVSGAFTETTSVVGQASRITIAKGEQITPAKIGVPVPDKGLSGVVPTGRRAISLDVDQVTAVGGLLIPGNHVDIIAAFLVKGDPNDTLRTQTILQNVEILSVGQEKQNASAGSSSDNASSSYTSGEVPSDVKEQPSASTLTLSLDPQQAQVLASIQANTAVKKIFTALRAFGDQDVQDQLPNEVTVTDSRQ